MNGFIAKYRDQLQGTLSGEVTISVPKYFRIFRGTEDPNSKPALRQMRQSVADLHARGEVSQRILDRYCDALAAVDDSTTLVELIAAIERPVRWKGKSIRALHPFEPRDHAVLKPVNRGEFTIAGFRNLDLQSLLYEAPPKDKAEQRRRSAAVGRKLRMLRAHHLIRKLPRSHRYQVTKRGRQILNAILPAYQVTIEKLLPLAA